MWTKGEPTDRAILVDTESFQFFFSPPQPYFNYKDVAEVALNCARPTRGVCDRALRAQEGTRPQPFGD